MAPAAPRPAAPAGQQLVTGESRAPGEREGSESVFELPTGEEAPLAEEERQPESREENGSRDQDELSAMRKTIERLLQEELRRYGIQ